MKPIIAIAIFAGGAVSGYFFAKHRLEEEYRESFRSLERAHEMQPAVSADVFAEAVESTLASYAGDYDGDEEEPKKIGSRDLPITELQLEGQQDYHRIKGMTPDISVVDESAEYSEVKVIDYEEFVGTPPDYETHSMLIYLERDDHVFVIDDEIVENWHEFLGGDFIERILLTLPADDDMDNTTFYIRNTKHAVDYSVVYER